MKSNYGELSKTYDISRKANSDTISAIISTGDISKDSIVVDFGCGTGNFTCAVKERTNCTICGVEPSDGMREKAAKKSEQLGKMSWSITFKAKEILSKYLNQNVKDLIFLCILFAHLYLLFYIIHFLQK